MANVMASTYLAQLLESEASGTELFREMTEGSLSMPEGMIPGLIAAFCQM